MSTAAHGDLQFNGGAAVLLQGRTMPSLRSWGPSRSRGPRQLTPGLRPSQLSPFTIQSGRGPPRAASTRVPPLLLLAMHLTCMKVPPKLRSRCVMRLQRVYKPCTEPLHRSPLRHSWALSRSVRAPCTCCPCCMSARGNAHLRRLFYPEWVSRYPWIGYVRDVYSTIASV